MIRRALAGVMLAASVGGAAAGETTPAKPELPWVLRNSRVPFRGAVYKPSTGLNAGHAPAGPYWPENALALGAQGYAVIDCKVAEDLRLKDCREVTEQPHRYGFGEAAQRMADDGWMTAVPLAANAPTPANGWWRFVVPFPRARRH
jgi:hypothetical protein